MLKSYLLLLLNNLAFFKCLLSFPINAKKPSSRKDERPVVPPLLAVQAQPLIASYNDETVRLKDARKSIHYKLLTDFHQPSAL